MFNAISTDIIPRKPLNIVVAWLSVELVQMSCLPYFIIRLEPTLTFRTAHRIDPPEQGFTDGCHASETKDAAFEPADSVGSIGRSAPTYPS